ncbi:MAG: hypothetical protein ACRDJM_11185, partial [Actinomycetota bacterium]
MSARGRRTARGCAAVLALALCALVPAPSPAVVGVVVKPGAMGVWTIVNHDHTTGIDGEDPTSSGTRGDFVDGPRGGVAGIGSFRQQVGDESDSQRVESGVLAGVRPDAIADLSYSTYVRTGGAGRSTQIQLLVDMNGDGRFRTAEDDVLTYEPAHNGGPGRNVWQTWNAAGGGWWSLRAGTYGPPLVTLSAYQVAHPVARVAGDVRGLRLSAGGDGLSWEGFEGNFDRVRVAGTEYDFESFFVLADCTSTADDIGEVQRAVDAAPAGYDVRLRGVCDFSAAAAHGGTTTSIAAAAVVLGSVTPSGDMVITSDGEPRSARVVGSGTQTAFFVPPGASNVTIRGIAFSSLARPIVVADAAGVTVGALGPTTPDPQGNSISGGATMNSAVLAVAVPAGGSLTVAYGAGGTRTATYPVSPSPSLADLTVAGNRIVYEAAGVPDTARNLVGVDVRQAGAATASGVTIAHNAVWFATNEFRSFDMNAIRVQGAPGAVPAVQNVAIRDNSLGRPEDIGEQAPPTSAGGRVGILVHRAANATIARNAVRTRASATGVNVPSGGIVAAETTATLVDANAVSVLAEPGTEAADLGAVGVVDDLGTLFGEAPAGPVSTGVEVRGNAIGQTGAGAQRGILVDGSTWVDVHDNDVIYASGPALAIGADVRGAGASMLPKAVATSVLCENTLEGVPDDPNQVSAAQITASNFPGGSLIPTNGDCLPGGIAIVETDGVTSPSEAGATDEYTVALDRRPRATVTVAITGGSQATPSPSNLTFTPADWFTPQGVTVSATQDALPEGTHLQAIVHRATSTDAEYNGLARTVLARIIDDDPGSVLLVESGGSTAVAEGGATDTYTLVLGSRPAGDVTVTTRSPVQIRAQPTGVTFTAADWSIPRTITVSALDDTLREGTHLGTLSHTVSSADPNFNNTPVAGIVATVTDNDVPAPPVILIPTDNSTVRTSSLVVTGTGERRATVDLTEAGLPLGSVVVPSTGRWSAGPFVFSEGTHVIQATQIDPNGFRSAATTRTFRVDLTPPTAPVIVAPAEGAVLNNFGLSKLSAGDLDGAAALFVRALEASPDLAAAETNLRLAL